MILIISLYLFILVQLWNKKVCFLL